MYTLEQLKRMVLKALQHSTSDLIGVDPVLIDNLGNMAEHFFAIYTADQINTMLGEQHEHSEFSNMIIIGNLLHQGEVEGVPVISHLYTVVVQPLGHVPPDFSFVDPADGDSEEYMPPQDDFFTGSLSEEENGMTPAVSSASSSPTTGSSFVDPVGLPPQDGSSVGPLSEEGNGTNSLLDPGMIGLAGQLGFTFGYSS